MKPSDHELWSKIIAPSLSSLIPGSTLYVSEPFTKKLPFEECGDFVWALVCISRAVPNDLINQYRTNAKVLEGDQANRLLERVLGETDFYNFSEGALASLINKLGKNYEEASLDQKNAHLMAYQRIEHILLFVAQEHPNAIHWLKPKMRHLRLV